MTPDQEAGLGEQDAPHLAKFGLLSEPFTGAAGPNFFYADANREQRLDLMQHLAPYSEVLIVIGGPGSGKPMRLQQFIARAGETWRTAVVSAHPGMDGEAFTAAVMNAFGLPMDASIPLERRRTVLINHLRALRQGARMPILIVDDAQHLDADAMELVLVLCEENETEQLLSTSLFGTPQLQAGLASPALAPLQSRVAHTFDVPPFNEHDTGRYQRHRMLAAGAGGLAIVAVRLAGRFGGEKAPTERTASLSLPSEHSGGKSRVLREGATPLTPPAAPTPDIAAGTSPPMTAETSPAATPGDLPTQTAPASAPPP